MLLASCDSGKPGYRDLSIFETVDNVEITFGHAMTRIPREEWDGLAERYRNPFLSWGYLALLETSGSMTPDTGWTPCHVCVRRGRRLVAAAPMYIRDDSWGDYVFDFEFARFANRTGSAYYPRLVGTIPATPAPVWRLMTAGGEDEEYLYRIVLAAAVRVARKAGLAGMNLLWIAPDRVGTIQGLQSGMKEWKHQYYAWHNRTYSDLGDCLGKYSKNMRRNILRERASVHAAGIETCVVSARDCPPRYLELMAEYYGNTNAKFGPYAARFMTRDFFLGIPDCLGAGWSLSAAFDGRRKDPVALALLFESSDTLYGRFWGRAAPPKEAPDTLPENGGGGGGGGGGGDGGGRDDDDFIPGLHFEVCYYSPMEYAIGRGLARFDPGMGSEHKSRRGFEAVICSSLHLPFDPRMARVFDLSLPGMNEATRSYVADLNADLPFRKGPDGRPATSPGASGS